MWAGYHKILVTGPQRSGTTIASRMVAADTGHRCVDETEYRGGREKRLERLLADPEPMVIQCPNFCHDIERFAGPGRLVVLMRRDVEDIVRSQRRIGWDKAWKNKLRYRYKVAPWTLLRPVAEIRYRHWARHQRSRIPCWVELEYESLRQHPLWVPPEQRRSFGPKQTAVSPGDPDGSPVPGGGVVVYRRGPGTGVEYLLLRRRTRGTWDLPKGKLEPGETPRAGALRETREETGLVPDLVAGFETRVRVDKPERPGRPAYTLEVTFFLGEAPGTARVRLSREHDDARWVGLEEAQQRLDPPGLGAALVDAEAALGGGTRPAAGDPLA